MSQCVQQAVSHVQLANNADDGRFCVFAGPLDDPATATGPKMIVLHIKPNSDQMVLPDRLPLAKRQQALEWLRACIQVIVHAPGHDDCTFHRTFVHLGDLEDQQTDYGLFEPPRNPCDNFFVKFAGQLDPNAVQKFDVDCGQVAATGDAHANWEPPALPPPSAPHPHPPSPPPSPPPQSASSLPPPEM
jgi:hypothetical protein